MWPRLVSETVVAQEDDHPWLTQALTPQGDGKTWSTLTQY